MTISRFGVAILLLAAPLASARQAQTTPAFEGAPLLTSSPGSFLKACRQDLQKSRDAMSRLKAMPPPRDPLKAMDEFDRAFVLVDDASSRAGLLHEVHPSKEMRAAGETCEQEASSLATEFTLDRGIYDVISGLDISHSDLVTQRFVTTTIRDFHRAGVDRDDPTRAQIKTLNDDLVKIGQTFDRNISTDVRKLELDPSDLDGLPDDFRRAHLPSTDGKVAITTNNTDYNPFMDYSRSAGARSELWKLYRLRAHPQNLEVLSQLLAKRYDLARLLGYKTWADYITGDKMVVTSQNASDFIEKITAASGSREDREYVELLAFKKRLEPQATAVYPWENSYLQNELKNERFGYDAQLVRPYFEYNRVKQGVLDVTSRMFGVTYRRVNDSPIWDRSVEAYDVLDGIKLLGRVYFDMHPRENKYKHYATFSISTGKEGYRLPEAALVCNFPQPGKEPALMDHADVVTFFHEFGHLLHHIFGGHNQWAGIDLEWDFIEAPSQMLEEWAWDPAVLQIFARHYKSNEPIPADLVERMKAADEFGKGMRVRQQMFYAALSLHYHDRDPNDLDTTKLASEFQNHYTPFAYVPGTYFQESFGHLQGYSAIYYTYMWSLVIAKDMFTNFKKEGLLNPGVAARYRQFVLAPGGSKPAADLVKDFLGRPYSFQAYFDWLNAGLGETARGTN
jgi:thimet oligopeptidase